MLPTAKVERLVNAYIYNLKLRKTFITTSVMVNKRHDSIERRVQYVLGNGDNIFATVPTVVIGAEIITQADIDEVRYGFQDFSCGRNDIIFSKTKLHDGYWYDGGI